MEMTKYDLSTPIGRWFDAFAGLYRRKNPTYLAAFLVIADIILFVVICIWVYRLCRKSTILLIRPSGSGKTVLFNYLRDGLANPDIPPSVKPSEGTFTLYNENPRIRNIKPVRVVDVPGYVALDQFLPQADAIVFVVDTTGPSRELPNVAGYLYDILASTSFMRKNTPLLILFNKRDKVRALDADFLTKRLEKEIARLHAAAVVGEPFRFSRCPNKLTFAGASGLTGDTLEVENFIRHYAPASY